MPTPASATLFSATLFLPTPASVLLVLAALVFAVPFLPAACSPAALLAAGP
ncbi:hypothetical protein ACWCPI_03800 [Streptomyces sp. NPDC001920]